jgi:chaperonin GroEL
LGPRGRNVILQEKGKTPIVTKDGVTIAMFVDLDDPFENLGAQIIKQASQQTAMQAGDGTTTSIVLARAILREAQKYISAGVSPTELKRGIDKASQYISKKIINISNSISSEQEIEHIASISANNDKSIGKLIATAVDKAGKDGAITFTTLDASSGDTYTVVLEMVKHYVNPVT